MSRRWRSATRTNSPQRRLKRVWRITIKLDKPTRDDETMIHLVTDVPAEAADAITLAELHRSRWCIENAFQEIDQALRSEVNTLCYPRRLCLPSALP